MKEETYITQANSLMARFHIAQRAKCHRTAKARLRELARLIAEQNNADKAEIYHELSKKHNL